MRDIGVQISNHNVVMEVHINPVLLLLCIYNHYRQQSTLALFISWLEIPIVMMHGAFWGMEDKIISFIYFFPGKALFVYA